jgi:putative DNA methylase
MADRTTMIEDYIPVREISYESAREKVTRRRNGHLSMLHLWWARRPLAACRGAIYATFAPPAAGEERERLPDFFEQLCHWTGPTLGGCRA